MIQEVVILGGGSAGLLAAITLAKQLPHLKLRLIRSLDIGVIGVGEGTTAAFPRHFFDYLKMPVKPFYQGVQPTWKLGIRFLWGPREEFYYTFAKEYTQEIEGFSRRPGFYHDEETTWLGPISALMAKGTVFPRKPDGTPQIRPPHAYHIENEKLVSYLEQVARAVGVTITDGKVDQVETGPVNTNGGSELGVKRLILESGESVTADLFVDASGFRSELLGKALAVPQVTYSDSLFCDRAVIAGWSRTNEPILPYTTAETMDHGWAWQIEHENFINRGYVYASNFVSDDAALEEFRRKNPQLSTEPRVVKFRSYRCEKMWSGNVVGIGNASGFVEPLEATALQIICVQTSTLADVLMDSLCEPTPSLVDFYNRYNAGQWDDTRDFLAVHYKFNTRLDTPFWQTCRADTRLGGAQQMVDSYLENGPSTLLNGIILPPQNSFGFDGYLAMLVGQCVPHGKPYRPSPEEAARWKRRRDEIGAAAEGAMNIRESIQVLRHAGWC
ncbi:tryptophan 7-halogenase [Luteolibacter pohnpeiensis]|uniref:Tryptophan 7-halogenase n=2 Tax=Luteolibacter pohnpeiensis TaxID=454153 RepID=A0A934VUD6_9BACT|nr:tryptophan 7-halogenase [Luteolibacter pohnpeiensis]